MRAAINLHRVGFVLVVTLQCGPFSMWYYGVLSDSFEFWHNCVNHDICFGAILMIRLAQIVAYAAHLLQFVVAQPSPLSHVMCPHCKFYSNPIHYLEVN